MNKPNNKRKRTSMECIEKVFMELLRTKKLSEIQVTDICKQAGLNRTTFYASYADVYDLADSVRNKFEKVLPEFYNGDQDTLNGEEEADHRGYYLRLLRHIKANQIFYKTYLKLGNDTPYGMFSYDKNDRKQMQPRLESQSSLEKYRMEFLRGGIFQIIKIWLYNGCQETPEELLGVVEAECQGWIAEKGKLPRIF